MLGKKSWICHSIDELGLDWYDDFYCESRGQFLAYADIYNLMSNLISDERITQEQADEWREKIWLLATWVSITTR
ncbi:hypothetical protein [Xanthomonas phage JGB6]|nr:hypothetical protein [Xanthomonas phage JGB6]